MQRTWFSVLSLLGILFVECVPGFVIPEFSPVQLNLQYGSDHNFSCPYLPNTEDKIMWSHNGELIFTGVLKLIANNRYHLLDPHNLQVTPIYSNDTGNLTCWYAGGASEDQNVLALYKVNVYGAPTNSNEVPDNDVMIIQTEPPVINMKSTTAASPMEAAEDHEEEEGFSEKQTSPAADEVEEEEIESLSTKTNLDTETRSTTTTPTEASKAAAEYGDYSQEHEIEKHGNAAVSPVEDHITNAVTTTEASDSTNHPQSDTPSVFEQPTTIESTMVSEDAENHVEREEASSGIANEEYTSYHEDLEQPSSTTERLKSSTASTTRMLVEDHTDETDNYGDDDTHPEVKDITLSNPSHSEIIYIQTAAPTTTERSTVVVSFVTDAREKSFHEEDAGDWSSTVDAETQKPVISNTIPYVDSDIWRETSTSTEIYPAHKQEYGYEELEKETPSKTPWSLPHYDQPKHHDEDYAASYSGAAQLLNDVQMGLIATSTIPPTTVIVTDADTTTTDTPTVASTVVISMSTILPEEIHNVRIISGRRNLHEISAISNSTNVTLPTAEEISMDVSAGKLVANKTEVLGPNGMHVNLEKVSVEVPKPNRSGCSSVFSVSLVAGLVLGGLFAILLQ